MKRLVCEMCGSIELLKQDDRYICQACGTNYTTEEAKKLLIEISGSIDVSGSTVKVDNSSFVQKSLANARRAKSKEDWEECERYYNMVEQHEPNNIEAIFYSSYGKARMAMVDSDRFKREQKLNVLSRSISIIDDNYDPSPERYLEQMKLIEQINSDLMALVCGNFVYNTTTSSDGTYNITTDDRTYTFNMFILLCLAWIESLQNIIKVISCPQKSIYLWHLIRQNYVYVYIHAHKSRSKNIANRIQEIDEMIKELVPDYQPPRLPVRNDGCYVATCVYGSYDCPQVWTLRRYRDDTLASTWYGRLFIHIYYALSPTIVKLFGDRKWFKTMWKGKLDKMVAELNSKGVENTPYQDRNWRNK